MRIIAAALLLLAFSPSARAETDPGFLEQYAATYRFSLGRPSAIKLTPDGREVLFLRSAPRSFVRDLYAFDVATGKERVLLTAAQILKGAQETLSPEEKARRERQRSAARGIASYDLSLDGRRLLVPLSGRLFVVERETGRVQELDSPSNNRLTPRFSPSGDAVALVHDGELYAVDLSSPVERRLTVDASSAVTNGLAEFIAQEEMDRFDGFWWSPDGRYLAYQQTDVTGMEEFHIADLKNPESEPQSWPYPRAGKKNARVRLGVVAAAGGKTTWIDWDREKYPYLATVKWEKNAPLTLLVQNRRQTEEVLLTADPATGATTPLLTEKDDAWLNLDQKFPYWLPDGKSFLWATERRGGWQLERRARDGKPLKTLNETALNLRDLLDVDADKNAVYALAGEDPTQTHLYVLPLDGKGAPRKLSDEPGYHSAEFSRDHGTYVQFFSGADLKRSQTVRGRDGALRGELLSLAEKPPFTPNVELTSVGARAFHAALIRPRDFVPGRRYPVIVNVYGGPGQAMVTTSSFAYLLPQWIADHGYIVVTLDGRGTPGRGHDWERAIRGNLIKAPLEDQADGLKALGEKYPELDMTRVGVYGWSFGGYFSAMAAMRRPDVFAAGVAGAPVADWADYDTHYTERYMGLPEENPAGYADASVLTHAPSLTRPLMIIHGTTDDNVYFLHSLKMSDALFRAGKRHEFMPLVGFTHVVPDPLVTSRLYALILDYFDRNLKR